jgi:hypothetical protein
MAVIVPIAAILTYWLYRSDNKFEGVSMWRILLMGGLRFLTLVLLGLFLLKPYVRNVDRRVENPQLIILRDNSSSMLAGSDSAMLRVDLPERIQAFENAVSDKFDVVTYSFDEKVNESGELNYDGSRTDISEAISEVQTRYAGRNVGALVLISDGNYNTGSNPLYSSSNFTTPIYALATGDTTRIRDLLIDEVQSNSMAFSGNDFPIVVRVRADGFSGQTAKIRISTQGKVLEEREIAISNNQFAREITFQLKAGSPGVQRYDITVTSDQEEANTQNNLDFHYIEVIDARQKVLIVAGVPHPDVAAIANAIRSNPMYEVEIATASEFEGDADEYALLILHQITAQEIPAGIQRTIDSDQSIWWITGSSSRIEEFNKVQNTVQITEANGTDVVTASVNPSFGLFEVENDLKAFFEKSPPLTAPFGQYQLANGANALLSQKVGQVATERPLFAISQFSGRKTAVLTGEGVWRWRIQDFAENESHERFDRWVNKVVQYLSLDLSKDRFIVRSEKLFDQNRNVQINAEVYNASYEKVSDADVRFLLVDSAGSPFPFSFSSMGEGYRLNLGKLEQGDYTYEAEASYNGEKFTETGAFTIRSITLESRNTRANHNLLQSLALKTGGNFYRVDQIKELTEDLNARKDLVPVIYEQNRIQELIEIRWLLFLLIGLLALEWFYRKFSGGY